MPRSAHASLRVPGAGAGEPGAGWRTPLQPAVGRAIISWGTLVFGSVLAAVIAVVAVSILARERHPVTLVLVAASTMAGAIGWGALLQTAGNDDFFHDAPIAIFPVSWEDVGTGIWTLAAASTALGFAVAQPRRAAALGLLTAIVVFLVDVYLYQEYAND